MPIEYYNLYDDFNSKYNKLTGFLIIVLQILTIIWSKKLVQKIIK